MLKNKCVDTENYFNTNFFMVEKKNLSWKNNKLRNFMFLKGENEQLSSII